MLKRHIFGTLALVALAAPTFADFDNPTQRKVRYVEDQLERGRHSLARVEPTDRDPTKLFHVRNAVRAFRLARAESVRDFGRGAVFGELTSTSNDQLADALVKEATIYYDRGSLPLAKKRVDEALQVRGDDEDALALAARIDVAQSTYSYAMTPTERFRGRRLFGPASRTLTR